MRPRLQQYRALLLGAAIVAAAGLSAGGGRAQSTDLLLSGTNVKDALLLDDGTLWAACAATGVAVSRGGAWQTYSPLNSSLVNPHPLRLAQFRSSVWTALYNGGLWKRDGTAWRGPLPQELDVARHSADLLSWRSTLWFTLGDRLGALHADGTFEAIHPPLPPGRGAVVTCLAADAETLYLGTNAYQIIRYDGSAWSILRFKGKLRGKRIRAISVYRGELWFGTFGGLYVYREPELRSVQPAGLAPPLVTSLAASKEALWVGTWGSGVFHYGDGRWHHGVEGRSTAGVFVNTLRISKEHVLACTTRGILQLAGEPLTTPTTAAAPVAVPASPLSSDTQR